MFAADMDHRHRIHDALISQIKALTGLEDTSGLEIVFLMHALLRALTRPFTFGESRRPGDPALSGPRWGLLLALMAHEKLGAEQGLMPSALSQSQGVSRNTISSLLRGLEEQGYIERTLDPEDRRAFRIRLTDAGREVVRSLAPPRMAYINQVTSGLSAEERKQLLALLEKLHQSVIANLKSECTRP